MSFRILCLPQRAWLRSRALSLLLRLHSSLVPPRVLWSWLLLPVHSSPVPHQHPHRSNTPLYPHQPSRFRCRICEHGASKLSVRCRRRLANKHRIKSRLWHPLCKGAWRRDIHFRTVQDPPPPRWLWHRHWYRQHMHMMWAPARLCWIKFARWII